MKGSTARVTALQSAPDSPMTVHIVVAGRRVATLPRPRCDQLGLHVDQPWTAALAKRVAAAAAEDAARADALRRLARRAHSTRGLEEALLRAGHAAAATRAALAALAEHGWLDDAQYAASRAEALNRKAPLAAPALAARLEAEGVSSKQAQQAAASAAPPDQDAQLAREARAARRAGVSMRTMAGRLARRGFDEDAILTALAAAGYPVSDA